MPPKHWQRDAIPPLMHPFRLLNTHDTQATKVSSSIPIPDLWTAGPGSPANVLCLLGWRSPRLRLLTEEAQHSVNQYSVVKDRTRRPRASWEAFFESKNSLCFANDVRFFVSYFIRPCQVTIETLLPQQFLNVLLELSLVHNSRMR